MLSLTDKLKVIDLLEKGQSKRSIAAEMSVSRAQINRIRNSKDRICES